MSEFEPRPFGKYFLTERIAIGGMAEIYKAKTFGVDGFEKVLAIKKILQHYSADKEFITMLTDEAKLVVHLSHANIVQVYDLGRIGSDYYISMEYIDGINLRELIERGKELGEKVPPQIALYIASEVCKGLDYAHSKRDASGQPLGIVHRDVSPQNILVSRDGGVKIVDFGIAKAAMNASQTHVGTLKGKVTYMAPEQAFGKPIDGRTDLFSLGIILYEMLTAQRLFVGESQMEILKKIRNTKITADALSDDIPQVFKPLVAKALAYSVNSRYQSASDFQVDLTRALYSNFPDFSPRQLATLVHEWFSKPGDYAPEPVPTNSVLVSSAHSDEEVLAETIRPDEGVTPNSLLASDVEKTEKSEVTQPEHRQKGKKFYQAKKSMFGLGLATLIVFAIITLSLAVWYHIDNLPFWSDRSDEMLVKPTKNKELPIHKPTPKQELNTLPKQENKKEQDSVVEKTASLFVESKPSEAEIWINNQNTGFKTPYQFTGVTVPQDWNLELKLSGYEVYEQNLQWERANARSLQIELKEAPLPKPAPPEAEPTKAKTPEPEPKPKPQKVVAPKAPQAPSPKPVVQKRPPSRLVEPAVSGFVKLRVDSQPRGAAVKINQQSKGITPIVVSGLGAKKSYTVTVSKAGYKTWTRTLTLTKSRTEITARLQAN